jgi:hypothetical protein
VGLIRTITWKSDATMILILLHAFQSSCQRRTEALPNQSNLTDRYVLHPDNPPAHEIPTVAATPEIRPASQSSIPRLLLFLLACTAIGGGLYWMSRRRPYVSSFDITPLIESDDLY